MYLCYYSGEPISEKQLRGNTSIRVLTKEEQEGARVACRVSDNSDWNA